ncbi:hypothetical protein [Microbacterium sp. EF45047]|uniref:hypothetical protein n=1 Tax=Microbacterium sp. EF45047 TaxID=2809708 RepID=UPI00234A2EFF|nr:hypothetical protein [Microbacterium sp. EF45047]WCM55933.1 hypothetical protein JRG78_01430 [Microbacterium sp. EF45047]
MRFRPLRSAFALAAVALLAAGCSSGPASPSPTSTAEPSAAPTDGAGSAAPEDRDAGDVEAAWLAGGRQFAVVTWGSSGCVPHAEDVRAEGQTVHVVLADAGADQVCTADFAPRATPAALPEGVDPTQDVELRVTYGDVADDADLEALAEAPSGPAGHEPSAGRFDDRGIVLLTWGSSSCTPVVESIEQTDAGAAVVFAEIDGVCTMDYAPRTTILTIPFETDDDRPFALALRGGGLEGQVPVLP